MLEENEVGVVVNGLSYCSLVLANIALSARLLGCRVNIAAFDSG